MHPPGPDAVHDGAAAESGRGQLRPVHGSALGLGNPGDLGVAAAAYLLEWTDHHVECRNVHRVSIFVHLRAKLARSRQIVHSDTCACTHTRSISSVEARSHRTRQTDTQS
jgi:hypothetical protein